MARVDHRSKVIQKVMQSSKGLRSVFQGLLLNYDRWVFKCCVSTCKLSLSRPIRSYIAIGWRGGMSNEWKKQQNIQPTNGGWISD